MGSWLRFLLAKWPFFFIILFSSMPGWDLKAIAFKDFTERVQSAKKYRCSKDEPCAAAIATCNGVDQALFDHFNADFKARLLKVRIGLLGNERPPHACLMTSSLQDSLETHI
jgi:hypothetical protein